ncbi:hypothetical protein ACLOJK_007517, partial [Asimina triloba]
MEQRMDEAPGLDTLQPEEVERRHEAVGSNVVTTPMMVEAAPCKTCVNSWKRGHRYEHQLILLRQECRGR